MKRGSIALAVLLGTAGLGVTAAAPAAFAAPPPGCQVVDTNANQSYTALQDAVNAAAPGDTLFVKGTCTGAVIGENLTITGQSNGGNNNGGTGTLTRGGNLGTVLYIKSGATVTINTLTITGSQFGAIVNAGGTVTINNSAVTDNTNTIGGLNEGGGIFNAGHGTMTLNNSTVARDTASEGGGIFNIGGSTLTLNNSTVTGNTALGGGGIDSQGGTVTLNGSSSVTGNTATATNTATNGKGGGMLLDVSRVTLNDSSSITGNTATVAGGGVYIFSGTVTLNDSSSITGNQPDNCTPLGSVTGCTG